MASHPIRICVSPAKAGTQSFWIPACAGKTPGLCICLETSHGSPFSVFTGTGGAGDLRLIGQRSFWQNNPEGKLTRVSRPDGRPRKKLNCAPLTQRFITLGRRNEKHGSPIKPGTPVERASEERCQSGDGLSINNIPAFTSSHRSYM